MGMVCIPNTRGERGRRGGVPDLERAWTHLRPSTVRPPAAPAAPSPQALHATTRDRRRFRSAPGPGGWRRSPHSWLGGARWRPRGWVRKGGGLRVWRDGPVEWEGGNAGGGGGCSWGAGAAEGRRPVSKRGPRAASARKATERGPKCEQLVPSTSWCGMRAGSERLRWRVSGRSHPPRKRLFDGARQLSLAQSTGSDDPTRRASRLRLQARSFSDPSAVRLPSIGGPQHPEWATDRAGNGTSKHGGQAGIQGYGRTALGLRFRGNGASVLCRLNPRC
ncbi:hypothetical protein DFJ74DRAFT_502643 [Hyaloraphidium curvatum]|nr:hypothetical protein DFJ74DRAFT_502643 [Hyaloraphidium curvatum]